jgi:hypothetical protein
MLYHEMISEREEPAMHRPLLAAALALAAWNAQAAEVAVPAAARDRLAVTVYNNDLALVRDRRRIDLPKGDSSIAFEGIAAALLPETSFLAGVPVIDQAFDTKLVSPQTLLEASLGKEIGVIQTNPATGQETLLRAKVRSATGGLVLETADGRLRTGTEGAFLFDAMPPGLRAKPTLLARVAAPEAGPRDLELRYLTRGLNWQADYVAELAADGKGLALRGMATIVNHSGADYPGAALKLVAGEVARGPQATPMPKAMGRALMAEAAVADGVAEESLGGTHLHAVERPVDLLDGQTRQVSLLAAPAVAARMERLAEGQPHVFLGSQRGPQRNHAALVLAFDNKEADGLGLPLPAGAVRLYRRDRSGDLQFAGADRMGHTAKGETVRLAVGKDFDLPVERVQTDYRRLADNRVTESAIRVTLGNGGKEDAEVRVIEPIPGDWEMLEESLPHKKLDGNRAEWRVAVPAGGKVDLIYRVRTRN